METNLVHSILYAVFGLGAVVGAISVILSRNVVYSALGLLANFVALAALYIMLSAEFLGVIQLIIYAGGIVVLFLFALMFVGGRGAAKGERLLRPAINAVGLALGLLLLAEIGYLVLGSGIVGDLGTITPEMIGELGNVELLGQALFTEYLLPFELVSVLLLVGVVAAVVLAKPSRRRAEPGSESGGHEG